MMKLSPAQEKFLAEVRAAKTREQLCDESYERYLENLRTNPRATSKQMDGTPWPKTMEQFGPRFHHLYKDEKGVHVVVPSGTIKALEKKGVLRIVEEAKGRFSSSTIRLTTRMERSRAQGLRDEAKEGITATMTERERESWKEAR